MSGSEICMILKGPGYALEASFIEIQGGSLAEWSVPDCKIHGLLFFLQHMVELFAHAVEFAFPEIGPGQVGFTFPAYAVFIFFQTCFTYGTSPRKKQVKQSYNPLIHTLTQH